MDATARKILEIVTDIQDRITRVEKTMATKEDIANLQLQINEHTNAIKENTEAIEEMRDDIRDVKGYAKEIDHLIERMNVVEQRVGIVT